MLAQRHESPGRGEAFDELLKSGLPVSLKDLVGWFESDGANRLRLPPIQRSLVWRNEQIVNYWDSLLRGYPAGLMLVIQVADGPAKHGVGIDNHTCPLEAGGYQLFDGQQRLAALLLGLGKGALAESRKLWVANGTTRGLSDLLFDLRVNSEGQPFGYKPDAPNEKLPADVRRKAHEAWPIDCPPDQIFKAMAKSDRVTLGAATEVVPFASIAQTVMMDLHAEVRADLHRFGFSQVDELLARLEKALKAKGIIIKLVESAILEGDNYARFFRRVGQGGTRLSDEELTYSLIKNRFPYIRDRMREIVEVAGRFVSEVDVVLGALRVAVALAPFSGMNEWDRTRRPTPDQVGKLFDEGNKGALNHFRGLLPDEVEPPSPLRLVIKSLREGLEYSDLNQRGVPSLLLARIPRDLLDTLLLFAFQRGASQPWTGEDGETLIAFVLYWLLFVSNDTKAASLSFLHAQASDWRFGPRTIAALVFDLEAKGWARHAPRDVDWCELYAEVNQRGPKLATWPQRFTKRDITKPETADRRMPGEALRVWSTHEELKKRGLMWLQRRYINRRFPNYDPTSARDDDLPLDVDHLIPQSFFRRQLDHRGKAARS